MTKPLRGESIVHVLATLRHGGAERVVLDLAARQIQLGAKVIVICQQQFGDLLPDFEAAGIRVSRVPGNGQPGALRASWRLAGALRKIGPTIVHTHNAAPQIGAGLGQYLRRWRRADAILIHTEHGRLHDVRPGLLRWRRWTARQFDGVFAVSADARNHLLEHGIRGRNGVQVVLNGVDLARFHPRREDRPVGTALVHVGRLDRIKGQDLLLEALAEARASIASVRLTIVGDGPSRPSLEAQARRLAIADIVTFVGAVSDIRSHLRAADVFVLPSRSEGISLALLEAMASGLAAVVTNVGGNSEVIDSGKSGVLVPADDPAELGLALVRLLQKPAEVRAMGAAARAAVELRFSAEGTADAYAREYLRPRGINRDLTIRSVA